MSEDTGIIDPNAPPEHAPPAPHDPSQPDTRRSDAAPSPSPAAPQPDPAPVVEAPSDPRAEIARRFQARRAAHDGQFMGDHKPPFVEHGEREAAADPAAAPQTPPPEAQPAPAAPVGYTLKFRGKEMKVATRDELLRLADVEPHEAADFTDDRLVRLAQKEMAASARLEEARSFHDQARVAAPAPAAPEAGKDQQQQPQQTEAKTLPDLLRTATEKMQLGSPEEAAEAWQAYYDRRDAEAQAARDNQSRAVSTQEAVTRDLRAFEESNRDIATNDQAADLLYMTATREMADDLRNRCGLTEEQLRPALNNPTYMTQLFNAARADGLPIRSNGDILNAAGAKVRAAMRMPAPAGQGQQPSSAVPSRIEEKRALRAHPTRSGHPAPEPSSTPDIDRSRKNAIDKMIAARRAPNVPAAMAG